MVEAKAPTESAGGRGVVAAGLQPARNRQRRRTCRPARDSRSRRMLPRPCRPKRRPTGFSPSPRWLSGWRRLRQSRRRRLAVLIAGDANGRAAGLALAIGRRLAAHGRAALVDLGDAPDRPSESVAADNEDGAAGLAELLEGRASFAEALHRDHASRLDLVPAGVGAIDIEALRTGARRRWPPTMIFSSCTPMIGARPPLSARAPASPRWRLPRPRR